MPCEAPGAKRPRAKQGCSLKEPSVTYVYLLRSLSNPKRTYIGSSADPDGRLAQHNAGESRHTARFRPWRSLVNIEFQDHDKAEAFERYLKSGSGHAFARRHFW